MISFSMACTLDDVRPGNGRQALDTRPSSGHGSDGVMEASANIQYVPLGRNLPPYVTALFIVDCGTDGFDETMLPEMGVTLFAIAGDWTWGTSPAGRQQKLRFGTLLGPQSRAIRVKGTPNARIAGFTLSPLGWAQLVGKPAYQFMGRATALEELFDEAAELVEHLAASPTSDLLTRRLALWLEKRLHFTQAPDPSITRMTVALSDPATTSVAAFTAVTGMTRDMLERRCSGTFGLVPDELIDRQIFLNSLRGLQQAEFEGRAHGFRGSYPDEAAFHQAFQTYMGQSVKAYLSSPGLLLKAGVRAAAAAVMPPQHNS
jgi:hypothetical protein